MFNLHQSWDVPGLAKKIKSTGHESQFPQYFLRQLTLLWSPPVQILGPSLARTMARQLCLPIAAEALQLQD